MSIPSLNLNLAQSGLGSNGPQTRSTITNPSQTDYGLNPRPQEMSTLSLNLNSAQSSLGSNGPQTRSTLTNPSQTDYGLNPRPQRAFIDIHNPPEERNDSVLSGYGPSTFELEQELNIIRHTNSLQMDQTGTQSTSGSMCGSNNSSNPGLLRMPSRGENTSLELSSVSTCGNSQAESASCSTDTEPMTDTSMQAMAGSLDPTPAHNIQDKKVIDHKETPERREPPPYRESNPNGYDRHHGRRSPPPAYTPVAQPQRIQMPGTPGNIDISGPGININIRNSSTVQVGNNPVLNVYQHPLGNVVTVGQQQQQRARTQAPKKKVTLEVPKRPASDADFDVVVSDLGAQWRDLGGRLGLSPADLDAVDYDNHRHGLREVTRQMLLRWREAHYPTASLKNLADALLKMKRADIVKKFASGGT